GCRLPTALTDALNPKTVAAGRSSEVERSAGSRNGTSDLVSGPVQHHDERFRQGRSVGVPDGTAEHLLGGKVMSGKAQGENAARAAKLLHDEKVANCSASPARAVYHGACLLLSRSTQHADAGSSRARYSAPARCSWRALWSTSRCPRSRVT